MTRGTKYVKLVSEEILQSLSKLNGTNHSIPASPSNWRLVSHPDHNEIVRDFKFKSFEDTWAFLTQVAMRSHMKAHHPTIKTTYNKVELILTTHDVNGLSQLDFEMANRFNKSAANFKQIVE